jgi:hypothetical protein
MTAADPRRAAGEPKTDHRQIQSLLESINQLHGTNLNK